MKATQLLIAAAAFASLAALSFAGPGPEYWARMNAAAKNAKPASYPTIWRTKDTAETKAKPAAKPATEVSTTCASCSCCNQKA